MTFFLSNIFNFNLRFLRKFRTSGIENIRHIDEQKLKLQNYKLIVNSCGRYFVNAGVFFFWGQL